MTDAAGASGSANGATITVNNNVAALEAALARARDDERANAKANQIARLEDKVRRARRDLQAAEEALDEARAALESEE